MRIKVTGRFRDMYDFSLWHDPGEELTVERRRGLNIVGLELGYDMDAGAPQGGAGTTGGAGVDCCADCVKAADKGRALGVATLDEEGKVPAAQLDGSPISPDEVAGIFAREGTKEP